MKRTRKNLSPNPFIIETDARQAGTWDMTCNVLHIGPHFHDHRGGIGAVLEVYDKIISNFKFIPTYANGSLFHKLYTYFLALIKLVCTLVADRSIRIVHIHTSIGGSFIRKSVIMLVSKLFFKKTILHIHSGNFHKFYEKGGLLRPYIRFIISRSDAVICLSNKWKEYYSSAFKIKYIIVINNVINRPDRLPVCPAANKKVNFLFLGHIAEHKGVFDLLKVLKDNKRKLAGRYTLVVAGNGEIDRFRQLIVEYDLSNEVNCPGWVTGLKKVQLLQRCDVYVLPSYYEGLPVSILEAMAYGKAILATTVGGIPEIVHSNHNGWLFEAGDNEALCSSFQEALSDADVIKQFGINSLAISAAYMPEVVLRSLKNLYTMLEEGRLPTSQEPITDIT